MPRERLILVGIGALLILGLIFGAVSGMQRSAWMEGYTMGQLTAAAAAKGAVAPVAALAPYAVGGFAPHHGPGFGGFFFLLIFGGIAFFIVSRMIHMARWRAWAMQQGGFPGGPQGAAQGGPQAGTPGAWGFGPPWMRHGGCGGWGAPEQAQPQQQAAPQAGTAWSEQAQFAA